ncbi:MAG TPA: papain-like cysteine protease family protein [Falsiroseomonas sp.]|nr:papain-like cysteine protease family protein [Falsiroseomonas sp.]
MADIYLDVPFVSQLGFGDPSNPRNDWTGCWYSSACMVAYFFEAGPRLGLPEKYDAAKGYHAAMSNNDYPKLMANEHLARIDLPIGKAWTGDALADLLRRHGPLSFGWNKTNAKGQTYGHRSVLIGWDDTKSEAIFHDPEKAPNSRLKLADYNAKFRWTNPYGMLRRDGPELVRPTGG